MANPTARDLARRVLQRVEEGAYTTLALAGELGRARLSDQDRALATELAYGVLKRRARLDWALAAYAPRGLDGLDARVRDALRVGAYQILFLRVPSHAAVDDAVEAVKRVRGAKLAGFVNALLRRLARDGEPRPPDAARDLAAHLAVLESAPRWLVEFALDKFEHGEAMAFLASLNQPAPVWLRANRRRATPEEVAARLHAERPAARVTVAPDNPGAVRVDGGGDPATTAVFAEGLATVQDLGAQRVARLLDPPPGARLLDACSGVGGKATHLIELAGEGARVDAADVSTRKLDLAADTARRLGHAAQLRTVACDLTDARAPLEASYDAVLLDAPCSGLGVLRRHPEAKWRPRPDLAALAATQARLLDALAPRVRPGGALVYAVCTFTDEEGPSQIARFLAAHPDFVAETELRTWPHRDDADAFFAARLRRRD